MKSNAVVRTLFLAALFALAQSPDALAQKTIRIAPQSNLAVLDPFWTTATVTRTHGYMIYDTLFGIDARNRVRPQMVDTWRVSADRRSWTFTLRKGLEFSDGSPVTSADVLASLARWEKRDTLGQRLAEATLKSEDHQIKRSHQGNDALGNLVTLRSHYHMREQGELCFERKALHSIAGKG